jgi:hypothetical protein
MTPDYAPSLLRSFERHLRAENRSGSTIERPGCSATP